jgi:hypothetical protein
MSCDSKINLLFVVDKDKDNTDPSKCINDQTLRSDTELYILFMDIIVYIAGDNISILSVLLYITHLLQLY